MHLPYALQVQVASQDRSPGRPGAIPEMVGERRDAAPGASNEVRVAMGEARKATFGDFEGAAQSSSI